MATHVDLCDSEALLLLSHREESLHKLKPALPAPIQPNLKHIPADMQPLLNSELASTDAKDCTSAPWLDPNVKCVPNRSTKADFQASIFSAVYGLPKGKEDNLCNKAGCRFDMLYAQNWSRINL